MYSYCIEPSQSTQELSPYCKDGDNDSIMDYIFERSKEIEKKTSFNDKELEDAKARIEKPSQSTQELSPYCKDGDNDSLLDYILECSIENVKKTSIIDKKLEDANASIDKPSQSTQELSPYCKDGDNDSLLDYILECSIENVKKTSIIDKELEDANASIDKPSQSTQELSPYCKDGDNDSLIDYILESSIENVKKTSIIDKELVDAKASIDKPSQSTQELSPYCKDGDNDSLLDYILESSIEIVKKTSFNDKELVDAKASIDKPSLSSQELSPNCKDGDNDSLMDYILESSIENVKKTSIIDKELVDAKASIEKPSLSPQELSPNCKDGDNDSLMDYIFERSKEIEKKTSFNDKELVDAKASIEKPSLSPQELSPNCKDGDNDSLMDYIFERSKEIEKKTSFNDKELEDAKARIEKPSQSTQELSPYCKDGDNDSLLDYILESSIENVKKTSIIDKELVDAKARIEKPSLSSQELSPNCKDGDNDSLMDYILESSIENVKKTSIIDKELVDAKASIEKPSLSPQELSPNCKDGDNDSLMDYIFERSKEIEKKTSFNDKELEDAKARIEKPSQSTLDLSPYCKDGDNDSLLDYILESSIENVKKTSIIDKELVDAKARIEKPSQSSQELSPNCKDGDNDSLMDYILESSIENVKKTRIIDKELVDAKARIEKPSQSTHELSPYWKNIIIRLSPPKSFNFKICKFRSKPYSKHYDEIRDNNKQFKCPREYDVKNERHKRHKTSDYETKESRNTRHQKYNERKVEQEKHYRDYDFFYHYYSNRTRTSYKFQPWKKLDSRYKPYRKNYGEVRYNKVRYKCPREYDDKNEGRNKRHKKYDEYEGIQEKRYKDYDNGRNDEKDRRNKEYKYTKKNSSKHYEKSTSKNMNTTVKGKDSHCNSINKKSDENVIKSNESVKKPDLELHLLAAKYKKTEMKGKTFEIELACTAEDSNTEFVKLSKKVNEDEDNEDEAVVERASEKRLTEASEMEIIKRAIDVHKHTEKNSCRFCFDSNKVLKHLLIAKGKKCYLCLPSYKSLTEGHCCIVPINHYASATDIDEDIWTEMQVFRKALTSMFKDQDEDVIFFESAVCLNNMSHMVWNCVPVPIGFGDAASIYFKKAILECETKWTINKKIVDLCNKDIRSAVPKSLPYFAVNFGMQGGYAHLIEDEKLFPNNFAEEIIGGMMDLDHNTRGQEQKELFDEQLRKTTTFLEMWEQYDITKIKCFH